MNKLVPNVVEIYETHFLNRTEKHFAWLNEILDQASEALNRPSLELLPKTPSQKKRRVRKIKNNNLEDLEEEKQSNKSTVVHISKSVIKNARISFNNDNIVFSATKMPPSGGESSVARVQHSPATTTDVTDGASSPLSLNKENQPSVVVVERIDSSQPLANDDTDKQSFVTASEEPPVSGFVVQNSSITTTTIYDSAVADKDGIAETLLLSTIKETYLKKPRSPQTPVKDDTLAAATTTVGRVDDNDSIVVDVADEADDGDISAGNSLAKSNDSLRGVINSCAKMKKKPKRSSVRSSQRSSRKLSQQVQLAMAAQTLPEEISANLIKPKVVPVSIEPKDLPVSVQPKDPSPMNAEEKSAEAPRMTTRSKARAKVEKIIAESPKRSPIKSPARTAGYSSVRPVSTERSGIPRFAFGSAVKNLPGTLSRQPSFSTNNTSLYKTSSANLSNMPASITSFIKRNTPLKQSRQDYQANLQEKIKQQEARQQEASNKKEEIMKAKIEEQKKKREERQQRVAASREQKKAEEDQLKRKLEEKHHAISNLKELEEQKKRQKLMKAHEAEAKRKEEERRAIEEARLRAVKEQERLQAEEAERARAYKEAEAKKKLIQETAKQTKKISPPKVTSTASSNNKTSVPASAAGGGGGNSSRTTFNVSASTLNTSKNQPNIESYEMTPLRKPKPSSDTNYDITDLNSSDETDDEEAPRKKVPYWAQGAALKAALVQQYYSNADVDALFQGALKIPELEKLFKYNRKRFHQRTSSAIWTDCSFQAFNDYPMND